jgi:hypothetical protein
MFMTDRSDVYLTDIFATLKLEMYLKVEKRKAFTERATESNVTGRSFGLLLRISLFYPSSQVREENVIGNTPTQVGEEGYE